MLSFASIAKFKTKQTGYYSVCQVGFTVKTKYYYTTVEEKLIKASIGLQIK